MKNGITTKVKAGVVVGTLDILAAFLYYFISTGEKRVSNVLKFIASGIFGNQAFSKGSNMVVAGLFLHYVIAFAFTLFFFWLYPKIHAFSKSKILTGILYGIFIWLVMNLVVVPLSNTPIQPFTLLNTFINVLILIVCMGIPLSLMTHSFDKKSKPVNTQDYF
jgi:uncharacterized membrane protein YagU involved in acid resistance